MSFLHASTLIPFPQVSLNSSRRVVIELDGGSVRADVGAVAEAVAALCSGDMPEVPHAQRLGLAPCAQGVVQGG